MVNRSLRLALPVLVCLALLPAAASAQQTRKQRVCDDSRRIASLLLDAQTNVNVSPNVWRVVGNEANTLANRIYGRTAGSADARRLARDLRTHVREMRKAALGGDAAGARRHAREAMPFATQLVTWGCR